MWTCTELLEPDSHTHQGNSRLVKFYWRTRGILHTNTHKHTHTHPHTHTYIYIYMNKILMKRWTNYFQAKFYDRWLMYLLGNCPQMRWISQNVTIDKSTLSIGQAPDQYPSHHWLRAMSPYDVTSPQWVTRNYEFITDNQMSTFWSPVY